MGNAGLPSDPQAKILRLGEGEGAMLRYGLGGEAPPVTHRTVAYGQTSAVRALQCTVGHTRSNAVHHRCAVLNSMRKPRCTVSLSPAPPYPAADTVETVDRREWFAPVVVKAPNPTC